METKVHCPGCQQALRVPANAAGRKARCPACHQSFVIPPPTELVEETISTWIEEDVEEIVTEHQRQWEARHRVAEEQARHREGLLRPRAAASERPPVELPPGREAPKRTPAKPPPPVEAAPPASQPVPAPAPVAKLVEPMAPAAPAPRSAPVSISQGAAYPTDLYSRPVLPHMVVESCTPNGVLLAFDSQWLEHEGFRLAMPVRCVFSDEMDRAKLLVRPLAFVDRSQATVRNPQEIESHYERFLGNQAPRDWLTLTGLMERLPKPFNHPLPYYLTQHHQHSSLLCTTLAQPNGSITCRVLIPNGPYALDWLGRVNGVCGPEYALLERDIGLLWSSAWGKLPEQCRQRLGVWCSFLPGEQFRLYLLDADFNRVDHGLAGLVVTNQRILFCKYHHRGQAMLDEEGLLIAQVHGEFVELSLETTSRHTRVARLHTGDLQALEEALRDAGGLKLQREG